MSLETIKTSDFDYELPEELIAQTPADPRDSSRLMTYNRETGEIEHKNFRDIVSFFKKGDILVVNNTRVIPARLFGKTVNGGNVEILLLKRLDNKTFEIMVKPGKKAKPDAVIKFSDRLSAKMLSTTDFGGRVAEFIIDGVLEEELDRIGLMPLPHYIKTQLEDKERYQTVYSKIKGSAAAPTAGLHFTPKLLNDIKDLGVTVAEVMLHVGLGTFRPVKSDIITEHKMHSEYFEVSQNTADIINSAKKNGNRIIAVGTTSVRVLESATNENGELIAQKGDTSIFIYPGYKFKCVDNIITNFHLPKSTLLMLISAFMGRENVLKVYNTAVQEKYRFFSFGDALLIK